MTDAIPVVKGNLGRQRLAFALDCPDWDSALNAAQQVAVHVGVLKVGLELFVREGPKSTQLGQVLGCEIFPRSEASRYPRNG